MARIAQTRDMELVGISPIYESMHAVRFMLLGEHFLEVLQCDS
jgi:hypothetical protein